MTLVSPDSHDLNFSNRPVRTRMPGGVAGARLTAAPYADQPIKALYWSAVINGVISVPIMVVMMLMAARTEVMGQFVISSRLKVLGWICTAVMAFAVIAMFWSLAQSY